MNCVSIANVIIKYAAKHTSFSASNYTDGIIVSAQQFGKPPCRNYNFNVLAAKALLEKC
jgi:hypothetical protein